MHDVITVNKVPLHDAYDISYTFNLSSQHYLLLLLLLLLYIRDETYFLICSFFFFKFNGNRCISL